MVIVSFTVLLVFLLVYFRLPQSPTGMPRYGHSLLEETRAENRQLYALMPNTRIDICNY